MPGCCDSMLFPMRFDIYYAIESQEPSGKMKKTWVFDGTRACSFYAPNDEKNDENADLARRFFKLGSVLAGMVPKDPRQDSTGLYHPQTHILITNIRGDNGAYWIEPDGQYVGSPTIFEMRTCQPFIGPFGKVDYWNLYLERSDDQEMYDHVYC